MRCPNLLELVVDHSKRKVGVVALAVIVRYRTELMAAFEQGIQALRAARGG